MKKFAILMSIAMVFVMIAGVAIAKEKSTHRLTALTGHVVKIDAKAGTITIKAMKEHTYKAEAKLLEGVAVGDRVKIEKVGKELKSIKKLETHKKVAMKKKADAPKAVATPAAASAKNPMTK